MAIKVFDNFETTLASDLGSGDTYIDLVSTTNSYGDPIVFTGTALGPPEYSNTFYYLTIMNADATSVEVIGVRGTSASGLLIDERGVNGTTTPTTWAAGSTVICSPSAAYAKRLSSSSAKYAIASTDPASAQADLYRGAKAVRVTPASSSSDVYTFGPPHLEETESLMFEHYLIVDAPASWSGNIVYRDSSGFPPEDVAITMSGTAPDGEVKIARMIMFNDETNSEVHYIGEWLTTGTL